MRLRLFVILFPLFSFLLLPVGIGLTAYYARSGPA